MPGYPQLRLALAAESAQPRLLAASKSDINEDDTVDDIISKVAYADASAVEETAQQLDREALTRAADAIAAATRVDLYGIGASAWSPSTLSRSCTGSGSSRSPGTTRTSP